MTNKRSDEYKNDAKVINAPAKFYDKNGYLIKGYTLMGKLHPAMFERLKRRASELPGNQPLQTKMKRYVEEVLSSDY